MSATYRAIEITRPGEFSEIRRLLKQPDPGQVRIQGWTVGQRVGVGFLGGCCGYCEFCRSGDLVNCRDQEQTGIHYDGGYASPLRSIGSWR